MMTLTYIFGAIVLLGLCIFVHELGHLLGGRMVGIKARVFSMGYGKGVLKKKIGDTTYQVTLIPFGGYCSFYGEDPGEKREGKGYEFLTASPWRRIVTVVMGPVFNLIFGVLLFYIMSVVGYSEETNRILIPGEYKMAGYVSPAEKGGLKTGDVVVSINGKSVKSFSDIQAAILFSDGKKIDVDVLRDGNKVTLSVLPKMEPGSGRYSIGIMPYTKGIAVTSVVRGGAADRSGLKTGDVIFAIDSLPVRTPLDFSSYLQKKEGVPATIHFLRGNDKIEASIVPGKTKIFVITNARGAVDTIVGNEQFIGQIRSGKVRVDGKPILAYDEFINDVTRVKNHGLILDVSDKRYEGAVKIIDKAMVGISIGFVFENVDVKYGPGEAFVQSIAEPWEFIVMNVKGFGMLFQGKMDVRENLSGPIRIAKIAGDVLYNRGVADFILLMAKISIILMIMNLLPIPAVDGSHIVFYLIEAVRGRPISEHVMARIQGFGVFFLIVLGAFVILNDITMLPFVQNLFK